MKPFTCPLCGIEQSDVYVKEGWLLCADSDRTTFYHCNSCGEVLLPSEIPELEAVERRIKRRQVLLNLAFWIVLILLAWH